MAFANSSISDIVATTIQSRSGVIADNVTNNNAALAYMKKSGNVKPVTGGNVILEELSFASNGNASYYSGGEVLSVAAQDVISAAQFDLKQASVAVTVTGLEQLQNSGKAQIIDLLEARVKVAEDSLANLLADGIYGDGTGYGGKEITGLGAAVVLDPTTGTYGGIDRATWSFWRNKKFDASSDGSGATTAALIQSYMNALYVKLVRGSDRPNLILMDDNYFKMYLQSLQANQRFMSADSASAGFDAIKFMSCDVVLDGGHGGNMPASTAYFLNTKYLKFRPHADRNCVPLAPGKRFSVNQDAEVQLIAWAGNMTCSNASMQGILAE